MIPVTVVCYFISHFDNIAAKWGRSYRAFRALSWLPANDHAFSQLQVVASVCDPVSTFRGHSRPFDHYFSQNNRSCPKLKLSTRIRSSRAEYAPATSLPSNYLLVLRWLIEPISSQLYSAIGAVGNSSNPQLCKYEFAIVSYSSRLCTDY
jgi:hypothetical protein